MNLLGSHDTTRIASQPCASDERIRLAYALMFFLPGAPCIYYGDEIGMEGGKDPDCRRTFPWSDLAKCETRPIYAFIRELIQLRNESPVLRDGKTEITRNGDNFSVVRTLGHNKMTLAVSLAGNEPSFSIQ